MAQPVPKPDYSNAGEARDRAFLARQASRRPVDAATAAVAEVAQKVETVTPRGGSIDGEAFLALVVDGQIEPLTVDDFCAYLESRYVLTPIP